MQIINQIKQDIFSANGKLIDNFYLIREKRGVHVYKCVYDGISAVVKYFENEDDKREIKNYRILKKHNIPTIRILAYGFSSIVMEDITVSDNWRLGIAEDLHDADIAESVADWYFTFHENGISVTELKTLYFEYDEITEENIKMLCKKFPETTDTFSYIITKHDKLRKLIDKPSYTLVYNDFYWTNFIVQKDKRQAIVFDYNLLGKGYRYSDIRNVCSSLSEEAGKIFVDEYNRLYVNKYGMNRTKEEYTEKQIDDICGPLFSLIYHVKPKIDFESGNLPEWAKEISDGTLLHRAKKLLE